MKGTTEQNRQFNALSGLQSGLIERKQPGLYWLYQRLTIS